MRPIALRVVVALVTLTAGVSAVGVWNSLGINSVTEPTIPFDGRERAFVTSTASGSDEQEILEIMRQYGAAQTEHDASFFERIESDSYTVTTLSGETLTKAEVIAMMKTWRRNIRFAHEGLRVELYGDVAIVKGWMTATHVGEGEGYSTRWQTIYLLTKRSGRWQILSATQVR